MAAKLVECVPNFSEGRDARVVDAIASAIASGARVAVLDCHRDTDHNRAVITFVAAPEAAVEAAVRGVAMAVERIDLSRHTGVHPRIGAADVVPFVPLENMTLHDCAALAHQAGAEIWRRLRVPVYFYEAAALRPEWRNLADLRRSSAPRQPDAGGPAPHPTAGATAVGARNFLIAYNINLATGDLDLARRIARRIRAFPSVKALGFYLESRKLAQVSMNLVDFERTPVEEVYAAVEEAAASAGVAVAESELIGMVPRRAYEMAPRFYERCANFRPGLILENRLPA
ncbi:MAG: glutamate formimidoyltransferase [Bryobacterales bacterium]|nr:glutamate formimidoyltransferase [Bryobacterales bacterium]